MGSRDRPHKEVKKKAKDKSSAPQHLAPMSEPPQQAELIKKARKPRREDESEG
jgi:hypothetical protein